MTLKAIVEEAKKLSPSERDELIETLIGMSDSAGVALTAAQAEDLDRRIDEYETGKAQMIDGDEAMRQLRGRR